jgi:hypothetical protein
MRLSVKKLLPFLVLLFVVMGCTEGMKKQIKEDTERRNQADARTEFADKISKKFELPGSRRCVADFYAEGEENKTLTVRPCSFLEERNEKIDLYNLFDSGTMQEVKRLGFTTMETERDGKTVFIRIE